MMDFVKKNAFKIAVIAILLFIAIMFMELNGYFDFKPHYDLN